jgi:hypothetical protein
MAYTVTSVNVKSYWEAVFPPLKNISSCHHTQHGEFGIIVIVLAGTMIIKTCSVAHNRDSSTERREHVLMCTTSSYSISIRALRELGYFNLE